MIREVLKFIYTYWFIITILLTLVVIVGSLSPVIENIGSNNSDKLIHIISYLILSFPLAFRAAHSYILIFFYFVIFGITIEVLQPHFNRSFELWDILANTVGTLLAIIFADLIKRYYSY